MTKHRRVMGELGQFLGARYSTAIRCWNNGAYSIVGSVPIELTQERQRTFDTARESMIWGTEEEAIVALLALGITHFQKADTSYYDTGLKPGY